MADKQSFLKIISALESSGGKNTNHRTMEEGIHAGQTAMGEHGLMPNTVKEMANRNIQAGKGSELDGVIADVDPNAVEEILSRNPDKYNQYKELLADKVLTKADGDPAAAAAGWLYGHNKSGDEMRDALEKDPEYAKRIETAMQGGSSRVPNAILDQLKIPNKETLMSPSFGAARLPAKEIVSNLASEENELDRILSKQQPDKRDGPQLKQGTGKEQPIENYKLRDEIQRMAEDAIGMANIGGMAKMLPKALNAAQALTVTPASKFGRVIKVAQEEPVGFGKIRQAINAEAPVEKLSIEQLRQRTIEAAKKSKKD